MFDLRLQFSFTHLDFVFPLFFCFAKKVPRPKLFWPVFYWTYDLILGRFEKNPFLTLPSALFQVDFISSNRFIDISFFPFKKIISKFIGKI